MEKKGMSLPTLWPKIPICAIFDMYGHENFDITYVEKD